MAGREREQEKRDRGILTGTRRKIVCAEGFQGVHPRVGPAPDTTLTPPFYGVVKYLSSPLALSYRVSLVSLSLFSRSPSSRIALPYSRLCPFFYLCLLARCSFVPEGWSTRVYVAPCVIAFRCVAQAQKACRASPSSTARKISYVSIVCHVDFFAAALFLHFSLYAGKYMRRPTSPKIVVPPCLPLICSLSP